ncbi:MurR/RpiR family transcriptional regulator [Lactiplantibacillus plantarum]
MNIQAICEKYQLNKDERKILLYMNSHCSELKNLSIRKLAKRTFTSPSFIVKTCKKMKLSGYSELVFLITDAPKFPNNTENDLKVRSYAKHFSRLMDKHKDSMIMILGSGFSQNIANYMSEYLNLHDFRCTANSHLELLRKDKDALIIAISNSGETKRLAELCIQAKKNDRDILSFVGDSNSTIAKNSSLVISSDTFSPSSFDNHYPQLFFGLTLIYFELLMSYFLSK